MKLTKLAPLLLAISFSPALADEYQDAISKAFPGFQILEPSEIKLEDEDNWDPKIYNERAKASPGVAGGRADTSARN